jgi:UDP-3-O-[3-hydroxymyristoyl] glucosamine N-acyltransferase
MKFTLQRLAEQLELEFKGEANQKITGVASLDSAISGDLCFIQQEKYLRRISKSECSALLVPLDFDPALTSKSLIFADNPHFSFVQAIAIIKPELVADGDGVVQKTVQVSASAKLGANVSIGAYSVIGNDVEIGDNTTIGAGCIIEEGAKIGDHCKLHSRVCLGRRVIVGHRCILQSGAVLGSDGFGLVFHQQRWAKIPHIGSVIIEDDVEIGANTTIDRGALDNTVIEQGCKLDNLIQIAHNVRIGAHTAIAACVGIAGSANIGQYCKIAGGVGVLGHLSIADNVTVTAMSLVTRDIKSTGVYSSGTPLLDNRDWHKNNARYKSLDRLTRTVAKLEKQKNKPSDGS